jgi:hypothetical protein
MLETVSSGERGKSKALIEDGYELQTTREEKGE